MNWLPSGYGSELSTLLLIAGTLALWSVKRQLADLNNRIAQHDEMWDDYQYKKRKEESSGSHRR